MVFVHVLLHVRDSHCVKKCEMYIAFEYSSHSNVSNQNERHIRYLLPLLQGLHEGKSSKPTIQKQCH